MEQQNDRFIMAKLLSTVFLALPGIGMSNQVASQSILSNFGREYCKKNGIEFD